MEATSANKASTGVFRKIAADPLRYPFVGSLTINHPVIFRGSDQRREDWKFVTRRPDDIYGIVRSVNETEYAYWRSEYEDDRLVFYTNTGIGYKQRIELRKNGSGDIRTNTDAWDLTDWEFNGAFDIQ
jgi:hypothetical protein